MTLFILILYLTLLKEIKIAFSRRQSSLTDTAFGLIVLLNFSSFLLNLTREFRLISQPKIHVFSPYPNPSESSPSIDSMSQVSIFRIFSSSSCSQSGLVPICVLFKKAKIALKALELLKSLNFASLSSFLGLGIFDSSNFE